MRDILLNATRVWLPVAIAVAGAILIVDGHAKSNSVAAAAGVSLLIVALTVWLISFLFRMSVQSNRDREREEDARRYFDEHGRWPDE